MIECHKQPKTTQHGFSFIEVMVVLSVLALMLLFILTRQGSEKHRASSTGLADVIAADLRAARSRAVSTGHPVAFCLPSAGGTLPHSQSYYLREGQSRGQQTSVRDLSSDFPNAYIAAVTWAAATRNRPTQAAMPFNVSSWLTPSTKDYCLIFNSDGSVWSNDLPLQNGQYTLLICSGLKYQVATSVAGATLTSPPPVLFEAIQASAPNILRITPQGTVSLSQGADTGLAVSANTIAVPAAAAPPVTTAAVAGVPTIVDVDVLPAPVAPATSAELPLGENLTISVEASDNQGGELFVEWTSTRLSGAGSLDGAFSSTGLTPMLWDSQNSIWKADVVWAPPPPPDGVAGDTFDITFTVSNDNSVSTAGTSILLSGVQLVTGRKMLVSTYATLPGSPGTYWQLQTPGGTLTRLRDADLFTGGNKPKLSPDGSKMAWCEIPPPGTTTQIYIANSDGSQATILTSFPRMVADPIGQGVAWNSSGTRIYFPTSDTIRMIRPDGTVLPVAANNTSNISALEVSGDGQYIAWVSESPAAPPFFMPSSDLWIAPLNATTGVAGVGENLTASEPPIFSSKKPQTYSIDLAFDPAPPNDRQILLYTGPPAGMFGISNSVAIANYNEVSKTATLSLLKDSFGNTLTGASPSFSPAGDELALLGDFMTPGLFVWGWNTPPTVTVGVRVDIAPFNLDWVTWR